MTDFLLLESGDHALEEGGVDSLLLEHGGGGISGFHGLHVREKPPLRIRTSVLTPAGGRYRWADDEPDAARVPSALRFSTTMPGGFETSDQTLPRKPGVDYKDLERLATLKHYGPGGEPAWEGRLERAPKSSGDAMAISPSAVGWQAHLEDDKDAKMIYRDIDLSRWGEDSVQRQLDLASVALTYGGGEVTPDATTGAPSLKLELSGPSNAWPALGSLSEATYDAGSGCRIGSVYYAWKKNANVGTTGSWLWKVYLGTADTFLSTDDSGNLAAAGPGSGTLTATTSTRRYALAALWFAATGSGTTELPYDLFWTTLAVYGDHGLTKRGAEPNAGFYASDIAAHAVSEWCPLLNYTTGSDGTVQDSGFVIQHSAFPDPTTASEIITQSLRFHSDWAWFVWEDKTFYLHRKGARGRTWRTRISPAQLSEQGPQVDRLFSSCVVQFTDVDGTSKTVGPVGSGADVEDASLTDSDPLNPINELGIDRRQLLQMGTATSAAAIQVGSIFLQEQKLLDTSGQATLVGHVEDDKGVVHPAWKVRAGDLLSVVDSSDPSPRKITKSDYDHSSRTCSVDLDSPPEGMASLLERLGANALSPLGLS